MPEYIPLSNEELELAAQINVTELLTLDGITDWNNPRTHQWEAEWRVPHAQTWDISGISAHAYGGPR